MIEGTDLPNLMHMVKDVSIFLISWISLAYTVKENLAQSLSKEVAITLQDI